MALYRPVLVGAKTAAKCGRGLHCIADVCVTPLGSSHSPSVGALVAKAVKVIRDYPANPTLVTHTHGYGTNVEGNMADV
jgi:uncharacterized protein YqgV (UPF0045/DUF77 family)